MGVHGLVVNVHKGIPPSGTDQSGDCSVRAAVRRLQARRMRRGGTSSTTREMAERAGQRAVSRSRGRPPSVFLKPTPAGRAATHEDEDEDENTEAVADTIAAERGADKAFSITNYVSLTLFLLAVAYPPTALVPPSTTRGSSRASSTRFPYRGRSLRQRRADAPRGYPFPRRDLAGRKRSCSSSGSRCSAQGSRR